MEPAAVKKPFVPRRFRGRISPLRIGVLALGVMAVLVYLAFTKELPWQHPFELKAAFQTSNNLQINSPVRIAGVDVGKVTKVERKSGSNMAIVTMEIDKNGLPIHKDASAKIRSRLFLEGNFFVDMSPGTPRADNVDDGETIPVTQTSTPVQLDQVLTALQRNDRAALQDLLEGLGDAFERKPTAADDATQDPDVRGETASKALNDALRYAPEATKSSAQNLQALLGSEPNDLSKLVAGLQKVTSALAQNETQLAELITNFNRFAEIFAQQEDNLRNSVRLLAPTVENANNSLTNLNQALPQLRTFARNMIPVLEQTPSTIRASRPWIVQTRALLSPAEGGGLLKELRPLSRSLAMLTDQSIELLAEVDRTSRCFSDVILPAGNVKLNDVQGGSGVESYKEFWYAMVGFSGQGQSQDGNGSYFRTASGGGSTTISTTPVRRGSAGAANKPLRGQAIAPPLGTQPKKPSKQTSYQLDKTCYKQPKPDLNGPASKPGAGDAVVP
jgi:virulence factor Mce-like protein